MPKQTTRPARPTFAERHDAYSRPTVRPARRAKQAQKGSMPSPAAAALLERLRASRLAQQ